MADISKCRGLGCPFKEWCYRFTVPEGRWQSWINRPTKDGKCRYFVSERKDDGLD